MLVTHSTRCDTQLQVKKTPQQFMTPKHPHMYDRNMICSWTLVSSNPFSWIALKFDKFIIFQYQGRCYDYVRVYKQQATSRNQLAAMCGYSTPSQIFRSQGKMTVTLDSSQYGWTTKKRGFLATVVEGMFIS